MWKVNKNLEDPLDKLNELESRLVRSSVYAEAAEWMWTRQDIRKAELDVVVLRNTIDKLNQKLSNGEV